MNSLSVPESKRRSLSTVRINKEKSRRSHSLCKFGPLKEKLYNENYHYLRRRKTLLRMDTPKIVIDSAVTEDNLDDADKMNNNYLYDEGFLHPSYALDAAVASNDSRLLHGVLSVGNVMIDTWNASGETAMHEAAFQGKVDCLEVFLNFGVHVDIRDKEGWTPLHAAVCGGDIRAVIFLIQHGANLKASAKDGLTPAEIAMDTKDKKMIQALSWLSAQSKRFRT